MALSDMIVKLRLNAKGFEDGLSKASRSVSTKMRGMEKSLSGFKKLGSTMTSVGTQMSVGLTAPIVGLGVKALSTFQTFEAGMNKVAAVSGATGAEFTAMGDLAKEMGSKTSFSATQAAEAMGFLSMAGFSANETMSALPGTLQLAAAGAVDLGTAADITSNVLTGYGLGVEEIGRANDVLAKTFTSTNTDLVMLGESMAYVGPVASSAGVQFEETAAAIGLLGNAGIQGSSAGTALRAAIAKLLNPSKDAAEAMDKLGLSATDASGEFVGFESIVAQLETSGANTGDMLKLFGKIAGPGMSALVSQGSDALANLKTQLEESGGTAERIANRQLQGWTGAMTRMKSATEGMFISIGEQLGPVATRIADKVAEIANVIAGLAEKFASLSPTTQNAILGFTALVAALGPVLLVLGQVTLAITTLFPGVVGLKGALVAIAPAATVAAAAFVAFSQLSALATEMSKWKRGIFGVKQELDKAGKSIDATGKKVQAFVGPRQLGYLEKTLNRIKKIDWWKSFQDSLGPIAAFVDLMGRIRAMRGIFPDMEDAVESTKDEMIALGLASHAVSEQSLLMSQAQRGATAGMNEASAATGTLTTDTDELTDAVETQSGKVKKIITDYEWWRERMYDLALPFDETTLKVRDFTAEIKAANEELWDTPAPVIATSEAFEDLSGGILQSAEDLAKTTPKFESSAKKTETAWSGAMQNVSTNITNAAQEITGILIGTREGSIGDAFKKLGESVVTSFTEPAVKAITEFIQGAIKKLISALIGEDGVGGAIGSLKDSFSGIFGGGGGSSVPGGGGGGGGGSAGGIGGLASVFTAAYNIPVDIKKLDIASAQLTVQAQSRDYLFYILEKVNEFLPKLDSIHWTLLSWGGSDGIFGQINDAIRIDLSNRINELREALIGGFVGVVNGVADVGAAVTESAERTGRAFVTAFTPRTGGDTESELIAAQILDGYQTTDSRGGGRGIGRQMETFTGAVERFGRVIEPFFDARLIPIEDVPGYATTGSRTGGSRGRGGSPDSGVEDKIEELLPPAEETVDVVTSGFTALSESTDGLRGALTDARMAIVQSIGMHQTAMAEWFGRVNTNIGTKLDTIATETRAVKGAIDTLNITVNASSAANGKQIADAIALRLNGLPA